MTFKQQIVKAVVKATSAASKTIGIAEENAELVALSRPKSESFGDYTTNIALVMAAKFRRPPMEVADMIAKEFSSPCVERVEIVSPGHINMFLTPESLQSLVGNIRKMQGAYGNCDEGSGKRVLVEFVSANPTGPIHLGNARGGPIGDSISMALEKAGYAVEREYYVNDFGNQVRILGYSVLGDEQGQYRGEYVKKLSRELPETLRNNKDPLAVGYWSAQQILDQYVKPTMKRSGIRFDRWFSEKSLHDKGLVAETILLLKEKGLTFENDGALWFRSTEFGDDKDRVLVKSDGEKTYIASDLAYHREKISRGYDKLINVQGADHHKESSVVNRFVKNVLGFENVETVLTQILRIVKDGKEMKMSKRKGVYFAFDDLLDEVGKDAVRFLSLMHSATSHIDFDVNLATEQSEKNPVYYVQYAHARLASVLRKASESGFTARDESSHLLTHPKERALLRALEKFPELIEGISRSYEVHRIPHYAIALAEKLHSFYAECRVIDQENKELTGARLALIEAVKIVLGESLRLAGASAPEVMQRKLDEREIAE